MCGIAGVYGGFGAGRLDEMLDCITHRGPDDSGRHVDENSDLAMGMRRLSIIDLDGGAQPIYNEDGTVAVVFNGEIYNYHELRESMESKGDRFTTESDTEVLVHLWEEYGEAFPTHLNGMFAFAIWDETESCLFLARDRLGIKPLYVTTDGDGFAWASELQSLLAAGVEPVVDRTALNDYFRLRFSPWPRTLVSGVEKVPPGHTLRVTEDDRTMQRYWSLPSGTTPTSRAPAKTVRELLEQSVERRLEADVPVGAFLSGGLDSSAIVGLMAQRVDDLKTFSVGFDTPEYDESDEAAFVADHFGTDHTELTIDPSTPDLLSRVVSTFGEPIADPAVLPTLLLAERSRQDVKVVQTGEGADELFGGYWYYDRIGRHRELANRLPSSVFRAFKPLASRSPIKSRHLRYLSSLGSDEDVIEMVAGDFREPPGEYLNTGQHGDLPDLITESFSRADAEYRHRHLAFDVQYSLPSNLLAKVDYATMQASLEARTPFLDHELVEFAHQIPTNQRFDGAYKPLLRRAMSDLLPERTMRREKQGFNLPIEKWFREGHESLARWLAPDVLEATPYVDPTAVQAIYDAHRAGTSDRSVTLWKVVNYVGWYETVLGQYE